MAIEVPPEFARLIDPLVVETYVSRTYELLRRIDAYGSKHGYALRREIETIEADLLQRAGLIRIKRPRIDIWGGIRIRICN